MKNIFILVLVGVLLLSACTASKGTNSAVYFVIQNHNAEADNVIGASTDIANAAEIHESKMDGDVMMMQQRESVALDSSAKVEFMPGGLHIMLIGLKQDINAGDEIEVTLQFMNSPDLTVKAMVKDADGTNMQNMDHSE